jgi:hypothetical protein
MRSVDRRELILVVFIACALVFVRSAVYLVYEQSFFDSDQAIIGLMAKHLIEGRAFPLFYYGQTYMLAVEAWIAAPFFLVAGATVPVLRASLVFTNLVAVVILVVSLVRFCGLRPWLALAPAAFLAFAPPLTAASLVQAAANIEPFVWILLLWIVVDRPLLFGAVFAVAFLNREFTIYALPPILILQMADRSLFRLERLRHWLFAAVAFFAVWQAVETLKPYADLMGPGTRGEPISGSAGSATENILQRVGLAPSDLWTRSVAMATDFLPRQIGARRVESPVASQGRDWMRWPIELGLLAAAIRAAFVQRQAHAGGRSRFGWYLAGVGFLSAAVYVLTRSSTEPVVDRYLLLTLYLPIGIVAAFLTVEPRRSLQGAIVGLVLLWGTVSAVDHARLILAYRTPGPYELRQLVDGLLARNIHVAKAQYWRAYSVTFLSQERVKVASTDVVKIKEYQELARAEGKSVVLISEQPCPGEKVVEWYLCKPNE